MQLFSIAVGAGVKPDLDLLRIPPFANYAKDDAPRRCVMGKMCIRDRFTSAVEITGGRDLVTLPLEAKRADVIAILLAFGNEDDRRSHHLRKPIEHLSHPIKRILPLALTPRGAQLEALRLVTLLLEEERSVRGVVRIRGNYRALGDVLACKRRPGARDFVDGFPELLVLSLIHISNNQRNEGCA